jgi:DNA-binding NarL/FixJ family response regulator
VTRTRILIADDHELVRVGLRRILAVHADWDVCGEADNGLDAVAQARATRPDLAILDYSMPRLNGMEATRLIRRELPETEVLVLTMHDSDSLAAEVLAAGAHGFMLKSDIGQNLVHAVESVLRHKPFYTEHVANALKEGKLATTSRRASGPLSPRERQIVQMVAEGSSTKDIARALDLSPRTVDAHRANVLRKLNLPSVADLVRYAMRNNIIEP